MQKLNRKNSACIDLPPIKVIQFGEGNFLRAFIGSAFQRLNTEVGFNAGIAVVQPIENGLVAALNEQDGLYTLYTKGLINGEEVENKELITNIVTGINPYIDFESYLKLAKEEELEFVISNTTEAGIAFVALDTFDMKPPSAFPAKLTRLLFERFKHFKGASQKGLTIIPCELINSNADILKAVILKYCSLWKLSEEFKSWVLNSCTFHNTLVDRIVPGYPRDQIEAYTRQLGYTDTLIVSAETFFLWVIEGGEMLKEKLPFHKTSIEVKIVADIQPFRTRKVRILNGAHTVMVPFSILFGHETVRQTVTDNFTGQFMRSLVFEEIIPTLAMEKEELDAFAEAVFDRFKNPFIHHQLSSIALNSISKFKVRVLPSLVAFVNKKNHLPKRIVFAFACLIRFYKGSYSDRQMPINDANDIVAEMAEIWTSDSMFDIATKVLGKKAYWDSDLNEIEGLTKAIASALELIDAHGVQEGFQRLVKL